ncbi:hypothetical protein AAVH_35963, partial [Aphelenchoides avenae]
MDPHQVQPHRDAIGKKRKPEEGQAQTPKRPAAEEKSTSFHTPQPGRTVFIASLADALSLTRSAPAGPSRKPLDASGRMTKTAALLGSP